jgi:hypothetical protein
MRQWERRGRHQQLGSGQGKLGAGAARVSSELRRAEAKGKALGRLGKEKKGGRGRGPAWWPMEEEGGSRRPTMTRCDGGAWAMPGTRGPAEVKENRSGPKKQCNFLLNRK